MTVIDTTASATLTRNNRIGLGLAAVLGVTDLVGLAFPTPEGETGPPIGILVLGGVIGVVTLMLVARAWRSGSRRVIRAIAGLRVLSMVSALPAFFVDIDTWVKVVVAVAVLLTLTSVVLMLSQDGRRAPVTD